VRHRASLDVFGDKKNLMSHLHIEPHTIQPIAYSLVTIPSTLAQLPLLHRTASKCLPSTSKQVLHFLNRATLRTQMVLYLFKLCSLDIYS